MIKFVVIGTYAREEKEVQLIISAYSKEAAIRKVKEKYNLDKIIRVVPKQEFVKEKKMDVWRSGRYYL